MLALAAAAVARGETPLGEVVVEAPAIETPAQAPEDVTAFTSVIDTTAAPTRVETLADALSDAPGVQVRRFGGLGDFATVSVRGFSPGQVRVYLDGVPLGRADDETVNLGDLPLDAVDHVEVYRSTSPLGFVASGPGGVVNVVTRRPDASPATAASASYGSFLTRKADATASGRVGPAEALVFASYLGSANDFTYPDDNGTPDDPSDDRTVRRINDAFDQGNLLARASWRPSDGPLALSLLSDTLVKEQGVPGRGSIQSPDANRRLARELVALDGDLSSLGTLPLTLHGRTWVAWQREQFVAPLGDPQFQTTDTTNRSLAAGAQLVARTAVGAHNVPALLVAADEDALVTTEAFGATPGTTPARSRFHATVGGEDEIVFWGERVSLVPGVRWEVFADDFPPTPSRIPQPAQGSSTRDFVSPRLGARVRALPWLTLQGNVGRYTREPNLLELFGNSGTVKGNPDLKPEVSLNGDLGVRLAGSPRPGWLDDVAFEAAGFAAQIDDVIVLVPSSVSVFVPRNLAAARIVGAELSLQGRLARRVGVVANWTHQDTEALRPAIYAGNQLPGRPADEAYVRTELGWSPDVPLPWMPRLWPGRVWADLDLIAGNFLDTANAFHVGSRTLVGTGIDVTIAPFAPLRAGIELRNLLDDQTPDVLAFPVPGRAVYVTLSWGFGAPAPPAAGPRQDR